MIRYLFDTDICIEVIRGRGSAVLEKLKRLELGDLGISTITLSELEFGAWKSANPERNRAAIATFCAPLVLRTFDETAASIYGSVRAHLERAGTVIGPLDMLIAAHALAEDAILVTNNEREFRRAPNLVVENWLRRVRQSVQNTKTFFETRAATGSRRNSSTEHSERM